MSNNPLVQRIMDDASKCIQLGWKVEMFPNNCGHWTVSMPMRAGLPACPYAGRTIMLDVNITWDYPKSPPAIQITSKIFHPHLYPGIDAMGCSPKLRWHEQLDVVRALQAVAYLLEAPYPRMSNACGDYVCHVHRAETAEARHLFDKSVKEFVRKAASFGVDTTNPQDIVVRDAVLAKSELISQALAQAHTHYQTLLKDLPFAHSDTCERRARTTASKPIIQAAATPGTTTAPPQQSAVTTDIDASLQVKAVVTKSAKHTSRLEVSMEGTLTSKRPKYCGAKIFQLFLQPSNHASRVSVTARSTDTPETIRHYASDVSLALNPPPPVSQSVRCICNRELQPNKPLWLQCIQDGDTLYVTTRDRCSCSLLNLEVVQYGRGSFFPSLQLLARHAAMKGLEPSSTEATFPPNTADDMVRMSMVHPAVCALPFFVPKPPSS